MYKAWDIHCTLELSKCVPAHGASDSIQLTARLEGNSPREALALALFIPHLFSTSAFL